MKNKIITLIAVAMFLTLATISLPLVWEDKLSIVVPIMFYVIVLLLSLNLPQAKSVKK